MLRRFGRVPSIFAPALTSGERLQTLWQPLRRLCAGDHFPSGFMHRLLALHHQQNANSYGVIWHLVALAEQGAKPPSFGELIELSSGPTSGIGPHSGLLDELEIRGETPWTTHEPEPSVTRALLALSLASTESTTLASTHRRRLRRIVGPEHYAIWTEAIMHVCAWSEWLRSYPEIDAQRETRLADAFTALCSQVPGLEHFATPGPKPSPRKPELEAFAGIETTDTPKRWRVDADSVHTGIIQADLDGRLLLTNAEARRIYRGSVDLLDDFTLYDFEDIVFREDGSSCPIEDFAAIRSLKTLSPQGPQTLSHRDPDGTLTWATYTASPLLDPQTHETVGVTVFVVDSTDHKLERAARQATEDRYRLLAQASDGMILLFDTRGAIITANDAAAAFIGANADSLTGKTLYELIPDTGLADAFIERNRRVLETGEGFESEEMIERGDG
ncbi:MAG TPA: PAS domain S-box protein, partial [Nannocystis exedens]|nr:PAS domain S-box protein [Nannocystis exedens]